MPAKRRRLVALLSTVAAATAMLGLNPAGPATATPADEPLRSVIVELDGAPAIAALPADQARAGAVSPAAAQAVDAARTALLARHDTFVAQAQRAGVDVRERRSLPLLINAVAMQVPAADLDALAAVPGVVAVHEDSPVHASTDVSVPLIGAPEVWERTDGDGVPVRGAGTTVAIVDTGVDYTHPDLGGGFGRGHKVVAGWDFVNRDRDPMDDNSHGTHVAGIIAGTGGGKESITGVAPEAQLTAYKVLDDWGRGTYSWIIAGLEAAVDPHSRYRADVVNLSLGGPGDGTDPLGRAATAAAESGVVVVAAAGNSGPGAYTVGSPASADKVIAVGASASGLRLPTAYLQTPKRELLQTYRSPLSANPPEEPFTAEVVDVGPGEVADLDKAGDLTGKIAIFEWAIPPTTSYISEYDILKAREIEKRGALAALGYIRLGGGPVLAGESDDDLAPADIQRPGEIQVTPGSLDSGDDLRMDHLVILGMYGDQYDDLARYLAEGPVEVTIEPEDVTDQIASFSSRGPTERHTLKPEIVAPGVQIRSDSLAAAAPYDRVRLSGTSMASPHVAGAAALIRQLHPDQDAGQVGATLIGSATALEHSSPTTVGAGRLDVAAAAAAVLTASPAAVSLGVGDMSAETFTDGAQIELRNSGDADVSADLSTVAAPDTVGTASVSPSSVVVPAGGTATVTLEVSGPRQDADAQLAGWVVADVDGASDLRVPYDLSLRPLVVRASPDPSDGTSTVFVWSATPLASAPTVTVTPDDGEPFEVTARHDHDSWYRAEVSVDQVGVHGVAATAATADGRTLIGSATFEVVPPENRDGGDMRWEPVGPNSEGGQLTTSAGAPGEAAMTTFGRSQLWLTDDKGATWDQIDRLPVAGGTGEVLIDPDDPDQMWYAVTGRSGGAFDWVFDPTYAGKVLRSTDGGLTWTTLDFPDVAIRAFVMDPEGAFLVAVTQTSVLVSHDDGDTWTEHGAPWSSYEPSQAAIGAGDLYVSAGPELWKVSDIGTRVQRPVRVYLNRGNFFLTGVVADDEMVATAVPFGPVLGSRNGGRTWEELYQGQQAGAVTLRMSDGDIVLSSYTENYIGEDHGTTWRVQPNPVDGPLVVDVDRWPGDPDTELWSQEQGGLFTTGDGGKNYQRIGVQGLTVYDLALASGPDDQPVMVAGTESGYYRTGVPAAEVTPKTAEWGLSGWEGWTGTSDLFLTTAPSDDQVVWRIRKTRNVAFFVERSADGGETWENRGQIAEVPRELFVHPDDPDHVIVSFLSLSGHGIAVTRDGGGTWKNLFHGMAFDAIAADSAEPSRLWLGNASGLYRSDDGGITVTKVLDGRVNAIDVDTRVAGRIVVGGDVIRVSTDGGATFATADSGPARMRVSDVVTSPGDPGVLYAGTVSYAGNGLVQGGRGVLRSVDGGMTWHSVSGGLQNLAVTDLEVSADGAWLFAATESGGVHRLPL